MLLPLRTLSKIDGMPQCGFLCYQRVIMLAVVVFTPEKLVLIWQRTYSFWGTTLPQLMEYDMTAGVERGSRERITKATGENDTKNRATCTTCSLALVTLPT